MTLSIVIVMWAVSVWLLLPRVMLWVRSYHHWLERRLMVRLEAFHIFLRAGVVRWVVLSAVGLSVVIAWSVGRSLWWFPVTLLVILLAVFTLTRWRLGKRFKTIRYQLPGVVELLATSLRAGLSIRSAFLQVSQQAPYPASQELAIVERMQRIGIPMDGALQELAKRLPIDEIKFIAFTISISAASGGNLADSLDRLANALRQRLILEEKVDALTAQGRLQSWVMVALPLVLAGALSWMDGASMEPLWMTSTGHLVLALILGLEVVGLIWIRRLIRVNY